MEFFSIFKHALMISFFVFVMMLLVDFVDLITNKRISDIIKGGKLRQYTLSSFFGVIPGCLGAFMNVSLYVRGIIGFGAVAGGMIATSGDEAFVMLSEFPGTALLLFGLLFVCGIVFAKISDIIIDFFQISTCNTCIDAECLECGSDLENNLNSTTSISDILQPNNFLANFSSLSFNRFLLLVVIISFAVSIALVSVIPESGPHLIFVMMFSQGLIPFAVLFTSSFIQDGHGLLPLLSYSVKNAILIKIANLCFGLSVGGILFAMGF